MKQHRQLQIALEEQDRMEKQRRTYVLKIFGASLLLSCISMLVFIIINATSGSRHISPPTSAPETISNLPEVPLAIFASIMLVYPFIFIVNQVGRSEKISVRLALTGDPGAGKTVFASVLYDRLMKGGSETDARFVGEAKSLLLTQSTLRGISENRWPSSTDSDGVITRSGIILTKNKRLRILLEIGDSAGEHWATLEEKGDQEPYLGYIASADSLIHVIPVDELFSQKQHLVTQIRDLQVAAQLANAARMESSKMSILVVFSKCDLHPTLKDRAELLFKPFSANDIAQAFSDADTSLVSSIERFDIALRDCFDRVDYAFSAAPIGSDNFVYEWHQWGAGSRLVDWVVRISYRKASSRLRILNAFS